MLEARCRVALPRRLRAVVPASGSSVPHGKNGHERKVREFQERPLRPGAPGRAPRGRLLVIGGREDKQNGKLILRELARLVGGGKIVIAPLASESPDEVWAEYEALLRGLGVPHVYHLRIEERADAESPRSMRVMEGATAVFFTGGDQLKITSLIGDTPVFSRTVEIFLDGGTIAGTSAGAAVMSETMIVAGHGGGGATYRIGELLQLAPGFGLAKDMVIDQHFAERGRMGRLMGVVAQNPRILGLGIDEDTAVEMRPHRDFRVLGGGGVYVVDGSKVRYTNVAEEDRDRAMSIFGVQVHVLSQGDVFDLATRTPRQRPAEVVEEEVGAAAGAGADGNGAGGDA
jgi:cyanophycinase